MKETHNSDVRGSTESDNTAGLFDLGPNDLDKRPPGQRPVILS